MDEYPQVGVPREAIIQGFSGGFEQTPIVREMPGCVVDQENRFAEGRKRERDVGRQRRLADAALVIEYRHACRPSIHPFSLFQPPTSPERGPPGFLRDRRDLAADRTAFAAAWSGRASTYFSPAAVSCLAPLVAVASNPDRMASAMVADALDNLIWAASVLSLLKSVVLKWGVPR